MFKKKIKDGRTVDRSNLYTTGKIGRTRETTPEGYLLCRDVAVARIGVLQYGKGEVPVTADNTGLILIERGEDELFNPQTIASFEGKSVTDDHPDVWVSPDNWKQLTVGTTQNVHRGEGVDDDFLFADLLITDKTTIDKVMDGKVEISLGYDAEYQEVSVGKGVQSNILGNHVALVDKGRCGSRCRIGDSFMATKPNKRRVGIGDRIRSLIFTRDADEAEKIAKQIEDEENENLTKDDDDPIKTKDDDEGDEKTKTGDAAFQKEMRQFMKTMDTRMRSLEQGKTKDNDEPEKTKDDEEGKKTSDDDDPEKTKDDGELVDGVREYTGDSLKDVASRAEILSPGFRTPTFDSANNAKSVLNTKRQVLKAAIQTTDGQRVIPLFTQGQTNFDTMASHTIDAAFIGASELIKSQNNAKGVRTGVGTKDFGRAPMSVAEINARNRDFWNKK